MLRRRTFLIGSSAVGVAACGGRARDASTPLPNFAVYVIDDETTFRDTGVPYLRALKEARLFEGSKVEPVVTPSYGRDGGALIEAPVVAVAEDRVRLERFFEGLPQAWRTPLSHRLVLAHQPWTDPDEPPRYGARIAWANAVAERSGVVRVEADGDGVSILLDRVASQKFEAASAANVGRRLAIEIDGEVVADPIVNERIPGGRIRITLSGGDEAHEELARRFML